MLLMILSLPNCLKNDILYIYLELILMIKELSATNVLRNKVTFGNQQSIVNNCLWLNRYGKSCSVGTTSITC